MTVGDSDLGRKTRAFVLSKIHGDLSLADALDELARAAEGFDDPGGERAASELAEHAVVLDSLFCLLVHRASKESNPRKAENWTRSAVMAHHEFLRTRALGDQIARRRREAGLAGRVPSPAAPVPLTTTATEVLDAGADSAGCVAPGALSASSSGVEPAPLSVPVSMLAPERERAPAPRAGAGRGVGCGGACDAPHGAAGPHPWPLPVPG